jgi:hypothetical protein
LERILEVGASLGVGALSSLVLSGWEALVLSATTATVAAAMKEAGPSERVMSAFAKRPRRLRDLALAGPGHVSASWRSTN